MSKLKVLISFLTGSALTFVLMTTSISLSNVDVKLTLNIFTLIFSIVTVVIAFMALDRWRIQIKHKLIFDTVLELEKVLLRFLRETVSESTDFDFNKLRNDFESLLDSRFLLQQRRFEVSLLKEIESGYRIAINELKLSGYVSKLTHEKLLKTSNIFSDKLNDTFR